MFIQSEIGLYKETNAFTRGRQTSLPYTLYLTGTVYAQILQLYMFSAHYQNTILTVTV